MVEPFDSLIEAAVRAPSGDNVQPWRFEVDPDQGRITVRVDEKKDPSPMNAGQRMSRIAVGAAVENLIRSAYGDGYSTSLETLANAEGVAIHLETSSSRTGEAVAREITRRVTNRRFYDRRPIDSNVLRALQRLTPDVEGVGTYWVSERGRIQALARLIGRADAVMFSQPSLRHGILSNIRFDVPWGDEVREGLAVASLELSLPERSALRMLPHFPEPMLKFSGVFRSFASRTRKLVESASGLCLVVAPDGMANTDFFVGRAMQQAWLALASQDLSVQPMMSLMVLENFVSHDPRKTSGPSRHSRVASLLEELDALAPEIGNGRPAALLRFGFAPPPSGCTGRLRPKIVIGHQGPFQPATV